jgi:hypothetical protein
MVTKATMVKHSDIERDTECEGPLISTYISQTKCGTCGKFLTAEAVRVAAERIEDHQTFYGLALVLVDDSEDW